jgi:hypothetical protein
VIPEAGLYSGAVEADSGVAGFESDVAGWNSGVAVEEGEGAPGCAAM